MSRSNRSFSHSNYQRNNSLLDTSIMLAQKDIDGYTRKLEFERKRAYGSQQMLHDIKLDMENRKLRIRQLKLTTEKSVNRKASAALQNLRKSCENHKKQYNNLVDEVNAIKMQINKLRKERTSFMEEFVQAEVELQRYSSEVETLNKINEVRRDNDVDKQMKLLELKETKNLDLSEYDTQFTQMKHNNEESQTKIEYLTEYLNVNKKDTFLKRKLVLDKEQMHSQIFKENDNLYESHDTITILKNRLKKIIYRNKNKVKILDDYMRNLTIIDDGFNHIKESTGMTDIQEIQNTFIKSEEQNHQLLTYSDLLNQQIDNLEDVTRDIEVKIQVQEKENAIKQQVLNAVPNEDKFKAKIQAILQSKQIPITNFQRLLDEIFPFLETMLLSLAESKFNTQFPYKLFEYQNGILLNEGTIDLYLSDLETYIMETLKYVAKKNGLNNAYTSSLLLEEIPEKEFKNKNNNDPQPNIPLNATVEADENSPTISYENQLYNYQSFKEQAQNILEKKKIIGSASNTLNEMSPNQKHFDHENNKNIGTPKVQRGNFMK